MKIAKQPELRHFHQLNERNSVESPASKKGLVNRFVHHHCFDMRNWQKINLFINSCSLILVSFLTYFEIERATFVFQLEHVKRDLKVLCIHHIFDSLLISGSQVDFEGQDQE